MTFACQNLAFSTATSTAYFPNRINPLKHRHLNPPHFFPKPRVAGSSPVFRSTLKISKLRFCKFDFKQETNYDGKLKSRVLRVFEG